uniref:Uncharacterized protein n=1 Tax=Arundo donax TaxID=35708 RepID=A0A0A9GVR2_ARUDO
MSSNTIRYPVLDSVTCRMYSSTPILDFWTASQLSAFSLSSFWKLPSSSFSLASSPAPGSATTVPSSLVASLTSSGFLAVSSSCFFWTSLLTAASAIVVLAFFLISSMVMGSSLWILAFSASRLVLTTLDSSTMRSTLSVSRPRLSSIR